MDPHYKTLFNKYLGSLLNSLPKVIADKLADNENKDELVQALKNATEDALDGFEEMLDNHLRQRHIDPLMDVVAVLPKAELAAMAEALVNLTSVKRKMSLDVETVGGPVDVALISKGDGFIWISRKHYFSPELNPHFSTKYLRTSASED